MYSCCSHALPIDSASTSHRVTCPRVKQEALIQRLLILTVFLSPAAKRSVRLFMFQSNTCCKPSVGSYFLSVLSIILDIFNTRYNIILPLSESTASCTVRSGSGGSTSSALFLTTAITLGCVPRILLSTHQSPDAFQNAESRLHCITLPRNQ